MYPNLWNVSFPLCVLWWPVWGDSSHNHMWTLVLNQRERLKLLPTMTMLGPAQWNKQLKSAITDTQEIKKLQLHKDLPGPPNQQGHWVTLCLGCRDEAVQEVCPHWWPCHAMQRHQHLHPAIGRHSALHGATARSTCWLVALETSKFNLTNVSDSLWEAGNKVNRFYSQFIFSFSPPFWSWLRAQCQKAGRMLQECHT